LIWNNANSDDLSNTENCNGKQLILWFRDFIDSKGFQMILLSRINCFPLDLCTLSSYLYLNFNIMQNTRIEFNESHSTRRWIRIQTTDKCSTYNFPTLYHVKTNSNGITMFEVLYIYIWGCIVIVLSISHENAEKPHQCFDILLLLLMFFDA
jgi:hypothetical protein